MSFYYCIGHLLKNKLIRLTSFTQNRALRVFGEENTRGGCLSRPRRRESLSNRPRRKKIRFGER